MRTKPTESKRTEQTITWIHRPKDGGWKKEDLPTRADDVLLIRRVHCQSQNYLGWFCKFNCSDDIPPGHFHLQRPNNESLKLEPDKVLKYARIGRQ